MNNIQHKKNLFELRRYLTEPKLFTIAVPVLLTILFHKPLENFASDTLVKYVFSQVTSSVILDGIFLLLSIYIILIAITRTAHYAPSAKFTLITIMVGICYCYYRFLSTAWIFLPFTFTDDIRYTDTVLLLSFSNTLIYIIYLGRDKNIKYTNNGLLDDSALAKDQKDKIGYQKYVDIISQKIAQSGGEQAIAIGINGKWGSGKTSFMNLIKKNLQQQEDALIIDIDPWTSTAPSAMIRDFFAAIQESIKPYHATLSRTLSQYAGQLIVHTDTDQTKYLGLALNSLSIARTNANLYEQVNTEVKEIGKRLIIFIDDLDRLDKDEIVEVIRLIRNTANFSNTIFVVAYDRNYVINALKEHNAFNHTHFLEKIFQLEISLPHFQWHKIQLHLVTALEEMLPQKYKYMAKKYLGENNHYDINYMPDWIHTLRDVSRLVNGLSVNLITIAGEIYFPDFLKLELLRLKFPAVYELLYRRTADFFIPEKKNQDNFRYKLKKTPQGTANENQVTKGIFLYQYLLDNGTLMHIRPEETAKIMSLLIGLFNESAMLSVTFKEPLSVVYPSRFDLYFSYAMLSGKLSEVEFSDARTQGSGALQEKIDQWIADDLVAELEQRFKREKNFDSRADFENFIRAICYFARKEVNGVTIGYDVKDFINKTGDFHNRTSATLYNGEKDSYNTFIRTIFAEAVRPYIFESNVIREIGEHIDDDQFALSKSEMNGLMLEYFRKYARNATHIDRTTWHLFDACTYRDYEHTENNLVNIIPIIPEEATKILITLAEKNLPDFLSQCIKIPPFQKERAIYAFNDLGQSIFGTEEKFWEYIDSKDETNYPEIAEFKRFHNIYKADGFSNFLPFNFEHIKFQPHKISF